MRALKNSLFFLLGVLLVGVPMLAFSETVPATKTTLYGFDAYPNIKKPTRDEACSALAAAREQAYVMTTISGYSETQCAWYNSWWRIEPINAYPSYICPANQGWTMIGSGSSATCSRPDCPSGQTRDPATGQCGSACKQEDLGTAWYRSAPGTDVSGTYCTGGCEITLSLSLSTGESYSSSTAIWTPLAKWRNGNTCTAPKELPDSTSQPPNAPPKNPPCATGDGVIALNSGGVYCVPKVTPGADEPKVSKEQKTQTFPDGSTSTTITTNTCTGHGACTSTTTITNTPGAGGGPGQAGPVGTSTGKTDKPVTDQPDFCKANPNLQICKGNIAEEATQKKILEGLETITKPTITDDSSLTEKGEFKPSDDLKTENDRAKDRADGSIDPISAPKGAWESAMSSGFWSPIPQFGCSPHSSKIGPFQWSFDPCPIASKISEIGAYALWFILAISTFVMLTGGRKS